MVELLSMLGSSIRITTSHGVAGMRWLITSRFCFAKLKKAILFGKKMVSACFLFHGNRTKNALLIDIFQ